MNVSWSLELGSCWCLVNELGAGWAYLDSRSNRAAEKVHLPLKQMETEGSLLRFPPGSHLITSRAKELLGRVLRWYCLRTCWKARWLTVGAVISCAPSLMRMWGSRRRRSNGCCKAHLSNLSWFLLCQGGHLCKSGIILQHAHLMSAWKLCTFSFLWTSFSKFSMDLLTLPSYFRLSDQILNFESS